MYIKAVKNDMRSKNGIQYNINDIHENDFFCDSAYATLEYVNHYEIENTIFLEVCPIGEFYDMGDNHSFRGKIQIIRVVSPDELISSDEDFARTYTGMLNTHK